VRGPSPNRPRLDSSGGSVSTLNTTGSQSGLARKARAPSPQITPSRPNRLPPGSKVYTLKLSSIQGKDLTYVSFPLCPVLKFRVDKQEQSTSKNLFIRSLATFPESFEFEIGALKYKSGTELEVEAVNVSPLTGEMVPIGEGRVNVQNILPSLNAHHTVTISLLSDTLRPAGVVVLGAVLLDRPVTQAVSYPTPLPGAGVNNDKTPFSPSGIALGGQFDPRYQSSDVKNAVFRVDRIVCHDMSLSLAARPLANKMEEAPKSDIYVVVEVGSDSLRTDSVASKVKQSNVHVTFERPCMGFDVDYDLLPSETLRVSVYEVPRGAKQPTKLCLGRAQAPLFSLAGRNDGVYTPASEFAMQLKGDDGEPVGMVSLFLLFNRSDRPLQIETGQALFGSPVKAGMASPTKHLRSLGMSPRLNNVRVPSSFHTGWVRISSIVATNLNKFRLVGNTARYKHLRDAPMTPVPAYLKHSELFGKQDPFVVLEAGEFWSSYSKVLLNQGWNCLWDQAAFCCYLSQVEASEQNMRVTVYDRSCSGYHNVFIGVASVPLINLFAATQRTRESSVELNVVDRRGKVNGKLELKYTWEASDEKERWSNGIVTRVCGDGCYDVRYDDGEEEFAVNKDVIRLISRPKASLSKATPPSAKRFEFGSHSLFDIQNGARVEVNDQGRGLWFPAVVQRNNRDGSYDVESAYDIVKSGVSGDNIRVLDDGPSGLDLDMGKRLNFEGSVSSLAGNGARGKFKLRDVVEGNYHSKGTWYVGKIFKVHHYEHYCTYDVDYLTGEFETEVAEDMIRYESARYVPKDTMSAYDLRALRDQRAEANVVIPLHRTVGGANATKSRGAEPDRTKSKFQAGQPVEVNYRGHGAFCVGTIEADYENGLYDVVYEFGACDEDVPEDLIRAAGVQGDRMSPEKKLNLVDAQSRMYKFEVGDRVEANYREIGRWIPGIITRDRGHGVFDVHYYDGRDETKVNFEHIRMADNTTLFVRAKRDAKYTVGQSVECNCERLGVWYHALIRNVLDTGLYNIQYDDGETEYDVEEDMLRPGGAYSPGIPSLKPFFKVGDRVKVACRSSEVEHELRTLSAIKQRIMEERKKLAEGKLVVAKRTAMQESVNEAVANAHRGLQGFKTRVGYSGDLTCCQAEKNEQGPARAHPLTSTGVSAMSFSKLDEIESAFANPPLTGRSDRSDAETEETLNDAITKAIVVEQSLGHIARTAKEEELAKAHSAHLLSIVEKDKADELALARAMDEAKARKRNNFSRDEELRAFREAYQKAELELAHIMAARQLVLEQDEALKMGKQKADLEAKCILSAQRKGERASARLREEDRQRLALGELAIKESRAMAAGHHHHHSRYEYHEHHESSYSSHEVSYHSQQYQHKKKVESSSARVQKALGPDVARERDALRKALVRVKEIDDELTEAKARAEQAGKEYAAADAAAQSTLAELQLVLDTNRQAEQTLTEDSTLTDEFTEYRSAAQAVAAYGAQASSKCGLKTQNVHRAESATTLRMRKEEAAAVSAEKRIFAEESMVRAARKGDMEGAKCAMREANGYGEQQGDDIQEAIQASKKETVELIKAKAFAEEERKMYASARDIAVLAAGLLRVIIADQREREYGALHAAKAVAQSLLAELDSLRELIGARDLRRINTTAAAQTEALAITQFRTRVSTVRTTTTTTSTVTSSMSTVEKTSLSMKILKAQGGREGAEEEIQRLSQQRMVVEESARIVSKKCEIEESVAVACAQDDAVREAPVDRFTDSVKKEQLHHFSTYSADECKAVRTATAHAEEHCAALREAKASALVQLEAIDTCRGYVQEEFSALSSLSVVEREELRGLVSAEAVEDLRQQLEAAKLGAIEAGRVLFQVKQRASEHTKELLASKEKANDALEELAKAQAITQHISPRDFTVDRTKASIVEGAQVAVREALAQAVAAEKTRQAAEDSARIAHEAAGELAHNASASERLRSREEERLRQAWGSSDSFTAEDEQLALYAAITHTEAQVQALQDATDFVQRETEDLAAALGHSVQEGSAIQVALAKEETILLAKAEWDQQKADAELAVAKKLLDGRITLLNDAQNDLERHVLSLDVMVSTLERAAKELVTRGDDDIDEYRGYQREFKRYECKKQKAAEFRKRKENKKSKAEVAGTARDAEEDSAVATEERIFKLEREAAQAEQNNDTASEVRALREARQLCTESTNALAAAKEYAAAEEELLLEAQDESEEERKALDAARDHAEEAWRLLAKALSVLPLKHRTPMGLMLLNGGDGFFKGVAVKPRKAQSHADEPTKKYDPSRFNLLETDADDVNGTAALRAADFKYDLEIPNRDSKELSFEFEANPLKAALRTALEDLDRAHEFLEASKGRTDDAERKYRAANAAATTMGDAVRAQEEDNAVITRRLYDNFVGVEAEHAQLQKVRSDLSYEDKCTANQRAAKDAEVKKVKPFAQARSRSEELASGYEADMLKALDEMQAARAEKDGPGADQAVQEARRLCDLQAAALTEAAQAAAKECTTWGNGTAAANKERASAEKAFTLAEEEARLLALIRAAQLNQGRDMYVAASADAEGAKASYDNAFRGMDGFADLVDGLKTSNHEREAELSEETKELPGYREYKEVRAKFEAERKRAQAAHALHDQEVAKALAARETKEDAGTEAEDREARRVQAEAAADEAHSRGDRAEEERLDDEAKQHETGVGTAYHQGTQSANTETVAWNAAVLHLENEKEALTAAHAVSMEAAAMLVQLRADQIAREHGSLGEAKQIALDCANAYEAANKRATDAAAALTKSRTLLATREALLGDALQSITEYDTYLELMEAAAHAGEQANEFLQEKLTERAAVDAALAAKLQDEKVALAAGTQRAVAAKAVLEAQRNEDVDAEQHALEDLNKFSDDEESALLSAKQNALQEAHLWGVATDFANEEANARITAKDNTNEAVRLLNTARLISEYVELERKKVEVVEAEQAYSESRKAVAVSKAKTPAMVAAAKMPEDISPEAKESLDYDRYVHRANSVAADANRPVIDFDVINAAELARAKAAGVSRGKEEQKAANAVESRSASDRQAAEFKQGEELERESRAVDEANGHVDAEDKAVLAATQFAKDELAIWKNLKAQSDNELKASNSLNDRAEEAARLLNELLMSEKDRLAEECVAALEVAAKAETEYYSTNKKTLARHVTLNQTFTRSAVLAQTLSEDSKETPEYLRYQALLPQHEPLSQQAATTKAEKDEVVAAAEVLKRRRNALELECSPKSMVRGTSIRELAAKFEKPGAGTMSRRAAQLAENTLEVVNELLATAKEEAELWSKAIVATIQEKEAYTASVAIFEEALLLEAATLTNLRERAVINALNAAEAAAVKAQQEFNVVFEEVDRADQQLKEVLQSKEAVEASVQTTDPAVLASAAFVRVQDRLTRETARLTAARAEKERVVAKATALQDARLAEEEVAADCATKYRRVVVSTSSVNNLSAVPSAALPRVDKTLSIGQSKAKTPTANEEDIPEEPATPFPAEILDGAEVTYKWLRAVFPDFGASKREKISEQPNMQALAAERAAADKEESALDKATRHAVEEERTWRLALEQARTEADALAKARAAAEEGEQVLAGMKDDIDVQERAALDSACETADRGREEFARPNGECANLGRTFEEKKETIITRNSEISAVSKETAKYRQFAVLDTQLWQEDEPAILRSRVAKEAAAERAKEHAAMRDTELANSASAVRAQDEAEAKRARLSAIEAATQEAAAWEEALSHTTNEARLLKSGVTREDEAIGLLVNVKAEQDRREGDELGAAEAEADAAKARGGLLFEDAERKHALYAEEKQRLVAKETEVVPDARTTPEFKRFEKLKAELEEEDEPFIFSKRTERLAATKRAESLVVAHRRSRTSVESLDEETAAWSAASDFAEAEVGGLDRAIDKAQEAQKLLVKANLDTLNAQGGEGEAGLHNARRLSADQAAALSELEARITETRAKLSKLQEDNQKHADAIRVKGPEFAGDVAAHEQTVHSVQIAVSNAESHRVSKVISITKATASRTSADEAETAYAKGTPLPDPSEEAARRRDALVAANMHAQEECTHISSATKDAENELSELLKAQAAALAISTKLEDASSARAYRTRFGYLMMGGDDELIPTPKRKPFAGVAAASMAARKFIDATRLKRPAQDHENEEVKPASRRQKAATEVSCDAYEGEASRAAKVLFEATGGGWASAVAAQLVHYGPYVPSEGEEYMPAKAVTKEVPIAAAPSRRGAKKQSAASVGFFEKDEHGEVSAERLRGKALFVAVVKHLMRLNRVVKTLKPLAEGELEELKERIDVAEQAAVDSSHFLVDTSMLQSKAGKILHEGGTLDAVHVTTEVDHTESEVDTAVISSNITAFLTDLERKDEMVEYESTNSPVTPAGLRARKGAFASLANTVVTGKKLRPPVKIAQTPGTEVTQFKEMKQVDFGSISSLLFGGLASSDAVAVLNEEEEDVVEHVKETTRNTTRMQERAEQHSTEETHTEETEELQTQTVMSAAAYNSGSRIAGAAASTAATSSASQAAGYTQPAFSPAAGCKSAHTAPRATAQPAQPAPVPVSSYDGMDDFGTAYEEHYDPQSLEDRDQFPSPSVSVDSSLPSPLPGSSAKLAGGSKKLKKVGSNSSVTSGGSSKRRPDSAVLAEMMSGNLDI
jgi:hypothetical protein